MPAPKSISLTARLRRVKLFLTDVDGVLVIVRQVSERRRRSILQPRVGDPSRTGEERLPWVGHHNCNNPERVAANHRAIRLQPFQGCDRFQSFTQGSPLRGQPWAEFWNAVGVLSATTGPNLIAFLFGIRSTRNLRSMFGVACSLFHVSPFPAHA